MTADTCDHATQHAGGWLMCEATGPHEFHWSWDEAVSVRWGSETVCDCTGCPHRWEVGCPVWPDVRECGDTREGTNA